MNLTGVKPGAQRKEGGKRGDVHAGADLPQDRRWGGFFP